MRIILTNIFVFVLMLHSWKTLFAQFLQVDSGTITTYDNSYVTLNESSLHINGDYSGKEHSCIKIYTNNEQVITGTGEIVINNLFTQGDIDIKSNIIIDGELSILEGIFNLNDYNLQLNGSITNENESSRIYTNGAGSIKTQTNLKSGFKDSVNNIGLIVLSEKDYNSVEFERGHYIQSINGNYSIKRYFLFPGIDSPLEIIFQFFNQELNGLNKSRLAIFGLVNGEWKVIKSKIENEDSKNIHATIPEYTTLVTLSEHISYEDVIITGGISPNGDSRNDFFIVQGIESYPNNKLIIFNRWGEILVERENYQNDWGGENENGVGVANRAILPDGTYFYVFFKNIHQPKSALKGSFEIKTGE